MKSPRGPPATESPRSIERRGGRSIVGNIYKGRVDNVAGRPRGRLRRHRPGQERLPARRRDRAAGRRAGQAWRGPARARAITDLLKPGQEIVVQVIKDPLKTKGVRLRLERSLSPAATWSTRPTGEGFGVSRRLEDKERRPAAQGGRAASIWAAAARSSAPRPRRRPRGLRARDAATCSSSTRSLEKRVVEDARDLLWSSRRPTCRCVWCATSSPSTSSVRSSTTRASTSGWSFFCAHRAGVVDRVELYDEPADDPLFEAYGVDRVINGTLERGSTCPSAAT